MHLVVQFSVYDQFCFLAPYNVMYSNFNTVVKIQLNSVTAWNTV